MKYGKVTSLMADVMNKWLSISPWNSMKDEEIARRLTIQILRILPEKSCGNYQENSYNALTAKEIDIYYRKNNNKEIDLIKYNDNKYIKLESFVSINTIRNYRNDKTAMDAITLAAFCTLLDKTTNDFFYEFLNIERKNSTTNSLNDIISAIESKQAKVYESEQAAINDLEREFHIEVIIH